jgi:hypothetical protein
MSYQGSQLHTWYISRNDNWNEVFYKAWSGTRPMHKPLFESAYVTPLRQQQQRQQTTIGKLNSPDERSTCWIEHACTTYTDFVFGGEMRDSFHFDVQTEIYESIVHYIEHLYPWCARVRSNTLTCHLGQKTHRFLFLI